MLRNVNQVASCADHLSLQWSLLSAGLVPSKLGPTIIQVLARLLIIGFVQVFADCKFTNFYSIMIAAWSLADIIRYSYYLLNMPMMFAHPPFIALWLRYTSFYPLYPMGVLGEIGILATALPGARALTGTAGVILIAVLMLMYAPLFPLMFRHMVQQRAKNLYPSEQSNSS